MAKRKLIFKSEFMEDVHRNGFLNTLALKPLRDLVPQGRFPYAGHYLENLDLPETNLFNGAYAFKHSPAEQELRRIQKSLHILVAGGRRRWTYGIFWKVSNNVNSILRHLSWGAGYYKGEEDAALSTVMKEVRKSNLRWWKTYIGHPADPPEDMIDSEWFFLMSKTPIFLPGKGLPGRSWSTSTAIWVTNAQTLPGLICHRFDEARRYGIQTLVYIPLADGVLELGSSASIFPSSEFDMLDRVRSLFNFRNNFSILEVGTDLSSIPRPVQSGNESESSVGNRPMFEQENSLSQMEKKKQGDSSTDSDSRYMEVFTQILRRGRG